MKVRPSQTLRNQKTPSEKTKYKAEDKVALFLSPPPFSFLLLRLQYNNTVIIIYNQPPRRTIYLLSLDLASHFSIIVNNYCTTTTTTTYHITPLRSSTSRTTSIIAPYTYTHPIPFFRSYNWPLTKFDRCVGSNRSISIGRMHRE